MGYWEEMSGLQASMGKLNETLGNPYSCKLSLRGPTDINDTNRDRETLTPFEPNPLVQELFFTELALAFNINLKGQTRRFKVTGINKKDYPRQYFDRQNVDLVLEFAGETLIGKAIEIKEQTLTWDFTLEVNIGSQTMSFQNFN